MNKSKPRKRRKKESDWIVSELDCYNANVSHIKGFTVYESDAIVMAIPKKNAHNITKIRTFSDQVKRKHNCTSLSSKNLKSLEENNEKFECKGQVIQASYKKDFKNMKCVSFESGRNYGNEMADNVEDNARIETSDIEEDGRENIVTKEFSDEQESFNENSTAYDINDTSDDEESRMLKNESGSSDLELSDANKSTTDYDVTIEYSDSEFKNEKHDFRDLHSVRNKLNYIHRLYKVENKKKYILHLPLNEKFYFLGKLQITLLYGDIEIFGYRLNHFCKNRTLQLYSPRRCMQLGIESKLSKTTLNPPKLEEILEKELKISENDFQKLNHSFHANDALILVERFFSIYSLMLDHYCDIDFFLQKEIMLSNERIEKNLDCILDRPDIYKRKGFTVGENWRCIKPGDCTIICGGKGVGKSTLLKFLINCELSRKDAVLCIDLDPGQTEFTTSGCVSAVVVKQPLFGPNFTNITTPTKMAFIGMLDVALDPVKYMKAVNYIVESCRENSELSKLPWFVNTMGFNKGIGLDFIINIIKLVKPDGVIQISSSDKAKNFEIKLNHTAVGVYSALSMIPAAGENLNYKFHLLKSCSRTKGLGFQSGFRPAELREFMILSYFSPLLSLPFCSLNAIQPRWIHFSEVYIAVNGLVQLNYILKAINGNLVALCSINDVNCTAKLIATTSSNNCFLKVAVQPEVAPSFGIGLVRGIDCKEEKIYIITPISNEKLENVNCLYLGSIDPPSSFYLKQKYVNDQVIYTDIRGTRNVRSLRQTFRYVPDFQRKQPN